MGGGRLGIGSPMKGFASERRAVSGMARVAEEGEMPSMIGMCDAVVEVELRKVNLVPGNVASAESRRASMLNVP